MPVRKLRTLNVRPIGPRKTAINRRVLGNQENEAALPLEQTEIGTVALTYNKLTEQIKVLERDRDIAKKLLDKYVDKNHKKDAKDNKVCKINHGGTTIELRKTARKATMYVDDAVDIIRGMSKRIQKRLLFVEEHVADASVVEEMILNGELKEEQAEQFVVVKTTYAFSAPKIKK